MRARPLYVSAVLVGERYRRDLGDLTELMRSMAHNGQLHPICVLDTHELLFGERRLEAARRLGWKQIQAIRVATAAEACEAIRADMLTATGPECLPLKLSEQVALIEPLYGLRQREIARGKFKRETDKHKRTANEVDSLAAYALGMSGTMYREIRLPMLTTRGRRPRPDVRRPRPVSDVERKLAQQALDDIDAGRSTDVVIRRLRMQLGYLPHKHSPSLPVDPNRQVYPEGVITWRTSIKPSAKPSAKPANARATKSARPRPPLLQQVESAASRLVLQGVRLRKVVDDDRWAGQRGKLNPGVSAGLHELHRWLNTFIEEIPNPTTTTPKGQP